MGDPGLVPAGSDGPGGKALFRYTFGSLVGGDHVKVENPEIFIYDDGLPRCGGKLFGWKLGRLMTCYDQADLRLGSSLLSKFHLFFSSSDKKVYFTLSEPGLGKNQMKPTP